MISQYQKHLRTTEQKSFMIHAPVMTEVDAINIPIIVTSRIPRVAYFAVRYLSIKRFADIVNVTKNDVPNASFANDFHDARRFNTMNYR